MMNPTDPSTWPIWKCLSKTGITMGMTLAMDEPMARAAFMRIGGFSVWPDGWTVEKSQA